MKRLILIFSLIAIITMHSNTYAEAYISITNTATQNNATQIEQTDKKTLEEIKNSIISDYDFNEYLIKKGITQKELEDVLNSDYFANYVQFELSQVPDDEIIASWDILEWHILKIKNFINYLFTGDKDYHANNNYDNYGQHHRHNNHNNMMPPPLPPPNTNWNNGWGQYPPNNSWNNEYNNNNGINNSNNNGSGNSCNCNCDNCMNCLNK